MFEIWIVDEHFNLNLNYLVFQLKIWSVDEGRRLKKFACFWPQGMASLPPGFAIKVDRLNLRGISLSSIKLKHDFGFVPPILKCILNIWKNESSNSGNGLFYNGPVLHIRIQVYCHANVMLNSMG